MSIYRYKYVGKEFQTGNMAAIIIHCLTACGLCLLSASSCSRHLLDVYKRKAKASFPNFLFTDVANALSSRVPPDLVKITGVIGWHALRVLVRQIVIDHLGLKFEYN